MKDKEMPDRFPFNLPVVKEFEEIVFDSAVTFFVGENGSGKSTVLEAIACGLGSPTIGGDSTFSTSRKPPPPP